MTNNKLCHLVAGAGGIITFESAVGIFFGAHWWAGIFIGILMCIVGLFFYEE